MAMQLGSAGNMFATGDPINQFAMLQENQRQNQELAMRQQALQASLRSQALGDEGQSIANEANRAKLDEFYGTADMRLKSLMASLTGQEADTALKVQESQYRPDLWRSEIEHTDAQTEATKANIDLAKQAFNLDKQKFALAKRAADQEFAANQINNAFKSFQMPGLIQEQAQRLQIGAETLKQQALQTHLMDKQSQGYDLNQTLDRFRAYQSMQPELRKSAKKYLPEIYGDMPDYFEDDDIKSMQNAIGVLHYLKEDPAMQMLGKVNPATEQVKAAAMQLLQRNMDRAAQRGKTDTSVTIDEAVQKMGKASKNAAKKAEQSQTMDMLAKSNDTVDRLIYHFQQNKAASNKPYRDELESTMGIADEQLDPDVVQRSPLGSKVSASGRIGKDKSFGWFRDQNQVRYHPPDTMPKKLREDLSYAVGGKAAASGTNKQVAAFRSLVNEVSDSLASGDMNAGKDIIESYGNKLGNDFFTDEQMKALKNLVYKFGWSD